ncbi:PLAT domain-containing protein 2 [Linum perenne]
MASRIFLLSVLLLLAVSTVPSSADDDECVFTLFVRTGSIFKGGTDSVIGARLFDENGYYVQINDLVAWGGLMEKGHNYFERSNLDIFSGRAPCLTSPFCALNLTSDGSGAHHGWYCNYVEATSTGVHGNCSQQLFTVEQWLATDTSPYELSAIRSSCPYDLVTKETRPVQMQTDASLLIREVVASA